MQSSERAYERLSLNFIGLVIDARLALFVSARSCLLRISTCTLLVVLILLSTNTVCIICILASTNRSSSSSSSIDTSCMDMDIMYTYTVSYY